MMELRADSRVSRFGHWTEDGTRKMEADHGSAEQKAFQTCEVKRGPLSEKIFIGMLWSPKNIINRKFGSVLGKRQFI